jgi:UDP-3-O-[3-hydroxymyristoyl] glucosamine N-acyltransferase
MSSGSAPGVSSASKRGHTVRSLAEQVGGVVIGEGTEKLITGVNDLRSAGPDEISFLGNAKYEPLARTSRAGVILVSAADAPNLASTRIQVESPSGAFAKVCQLFAPPPLRHAPGIHPTAVIAPDAVIGEGVSIQPHVVIGAGVRIGAGTVIGANSFIGEESVLGETCLIHPLVAIRERSILGARVIVHSGAVIGGDGFGYTSENGRHIKIEHSGHVQIDNDVEIGANTTIDRARFGKTHIGEGTKIDNLVMIAHNVVVGAHCILVSQTGISGSTTLGRYVTLAGQVGVAGHLHLGDHSTLTAQSGINKDVPDGAFLSGHHALPARESLKLEALTRRLPELVARLKSLEDKVRELS